MTKQSKDDLFIENIRKYKDSLYRLAISILRNESDAEDAVGEAILKAYKHINSLSSIKKFKPWIMQILANECYRIHGLRKRNVYVEDMEEHMEEHTPTVYDSSQNNQEMWQMVNDLEEDFRVIVVLFYYEDMSISGISKILNIPSGTVKSRLSRARQKLRVLIEKEEV